MVRLVVPLRVQVGVLQPEVGRQVDDGADLLAQLRHDALRCPMGQREEHEVEAIQASGSYGVKTRFGYAAAKLG